MTLESKYASLQQQFETEANQARTATNMVKGEETEIRRLDGSEYNKVAVTFFSDDGTEAQLVFNQEHGPKPFQELFTFVRNLRFQTMQGHQANLARLEANLNKCLSAWQKPEDPPSDRGGDDEDEGPKEPPKSPNGRAKKVEVPAKIRDRAKPVAEPEPVAKSSSEEAK